jgi:hypothetical protein
MLFLRAATLGFSGFFRALIFFWIPDGDWEVLFPERVENIENMSAAKVAERMARNGFRLMDNL